ncbi:MAG: RNA polymerase sigma factor [Acidimicrobiales bacterium]
MREESMGAAAAVPDLSAETEHPLSASPAVPDGFEQLYRANYRKLVQLAYLLTQSAETADDLVQDVFARVLPRWQRLDDPVPYLRRSVVNAANSWRRRLRLERRRQANVEESASLHADELFDVLAQLPTRQRSAVVLRFYEGLNDAEVAAVLGCRPGTVASLVHRAFERMRQAMADGPGPELGQRPSEDDEGLPEKAVREGDQR